MKFKRTLYCLIAISLLLAGMEAAGRWLLAKGYRFEMILRNPPVGLSLTPKWRGTYHGAGVRISSQGFRDDEIPLVKSPGEYRVVVIGDSRVFGFGVPQEEAFAQQLERRLQEHCPKRPITVLNAGVPGYTSREALRFVETRAFDLAPDLLIVAVGHNDRWMVEKRTGLKISPTIVQLPDSSPPPGKGLVTLLRAGLKPLDDWLETISRYDRLKNRLVISLRRKFRPVPQREWTDVTFGYMVSPDEYRRNLNRLIALARRRKVDVLLVEITDNPGIFQHGDRGATLYNQENPDEAVREFNTVIDGYKMNFSPLPYYYLGLIARKNGDSEKASRYFLLAEIGAAYFPLPGIETIVDYWQAAGRKLKRQLTVEALGEMRAIVDPRFLARNYFRIARELAEEQGVEAMEIDEDLLPEGMFLPGDVDHPNITGHRAIAGELFRFLVKDGYL